MTTTRHAPTVTLREDHGTVGTLTGSSDLARPEPSTTTTSDGGDSKGKAPDFEDLPVPAGKPLQVDWEHVVEEGDSCTYELRIRQGNRVIFHREALEGESFGLRNEDVREMVQRLRSSASKEPPASVRLTIEVIAHYEPERPHQALMTLDQTTHELRLRDPHDAPVQMSA